jgi:autotransporter translocation and assembly factor TamB
VDRRDFLVSMLQSLLLALFPWLRTERGRQVLAAGVEELVPADMVYGGWGQRAHWYMVRSYNFTWTA